MIEDNRNHKVKSDYGSLDYYNFFCKKNTEIEISRGLFGAILKEFNTHVRDRISFKGEEFIMPYRTGKVELRKIKNEVSIDENGEIINNMPTNWQATRKLWNESEAARKKKIKVRFTNEHTNGYTFKIFYRKSKANFKWKSVYKLQFNRTMKRQLSDSIFKGKIDAFLN